MSVKSCIVKRCQSDVGHGVDGRPGRHKNLDVTDLVGTEKAFGAHLDDLSTTIIGCMVKRCPSEVGHSVDSRPGRQESLYAASLIGAENASSVNPDDR